MKMLYKTWQVPLFTFCCLLGLQSAKAQSIQLTDEQQKAFSIQTAEVETQNIFPSQWFLGHLDVINQAEQTLSSPLIGRISKIHKHSGHVMPNEPLVEMISPQITQLQSQLLSTIAKLSVAQKDAKRLKRLSHSGSASAQDYQATQAEAISLEATQAEIEQSLLEYGFANSALQQLKKTNQLQTSRVIIKSEVEAEIHDVMVMVGQNMDEYKPLITLLNHENLMIKVPVPVHQSTDLKIGDRAQVKVGNQTLNASVFFIPHHLDALTQTQEVQLQFSESIKSLNLSLNQRVEVQFQQTAPSNLYKTSLQSLTQSEGQDMVFAEVKDGQYETVDIKVHTTEQNTMYFQPLQETTLQKVVTQGTSALKLALGAEEE